MFLPLFCVENDPKTGWEADTVEEGRMQRKRRPDKNENLAALPGRSLLAGEVRGIVESL